MARPVILALSSFRYTEKEVEHALRRCADQGAPLVALFVVDVNVARYFAASGVMVGTSLREEMEHGVMEEHKRQAREALDRVCATAAERGIECKPVLAVGRFAEEAKNAVREEEPQVIILTRARRPEWLRRLFGSPVDRLRQELAGECEIEVV